MVFTLRLGNGRLIGVNGDFIGLKLEFLCVTLQFIETNSVADIAVTVVSAGSVFCGLLPMLDVALDPTLVGDFGFVDRDISAVLDKSPSGYGSDLVPIVLIVGRITKSWSIDSSSDEILEGGLSVDVLGLVRESVGGSGNSCTFLSEVVCSVLCLLITILLEQLSGEMWGFSIEGVH
jgi:hypothetical protein